MKKVMIKIKGTQGLGEDVSEVEFLGEGTLKKSGEAYIVTYCDSAAAGGAPVKTVLTANGNDSVVLERTGAISSRLLIEKGVRNNCFYSVPEGNLTLGIYGKAIENRLNEWGGEIKMIYTLDANMRLISENTVEISVQRR